MNLNIDVHLNMERGMYERLVERAQELGMPLSAVVRDAVAQYFQNLPVPPDRSYAGSIPDDPIWEMPTLSATFGELLTPAHRRAQAEEGGDA
ncbi:MAG: hypothetical protein ABI670_14240 [Chloroflexota bacterium]